MSSSNVLLLCPGVALPLRISEMNVKGSYYRPYTGLHAMNIHTDFGSILLYKSGAVVMYTKSTEDILLCLLRLREIILNSES